MTSTERRMKLILLLQQSTKRLTVKDIAEKFYVSQRTVYRDFNALSKMNVPVMWDKFKGYGVIDTYKVPPLMFSSRELATVLVGLNFVKSQMDKTLVEDAKGVELKIKEALPKELIDFMESIEERTVVDPYLNFGAEKIKGGNWYEISNAISQNRTIEFTYRAKSDEGINTRKIDPYLLVFYRDHWNVIGHSHKREAIRNFVLDRMSDIEILEKKFTANGQIDAEGLIFRSEETDFKIVVEVQEAAVQRFRVNLPTKIIKNKRIGPNLFRISFLFDNLEFINEWLLQFSTEVKIVGPQILIKKRKDLLQELIQKL